MTTFDRDKEAYVVPVAYSGVSYCYVKGVDSHIDAQHVAIKSVKQLLADEIEGRDITAGTWPLAAEVIVGDTNLEDVEVL